MDVWEKEKLQRVPLKPVSQTVRLRPIPGERRSRRSRRRRESRCLIL
jgi:hypothetical protein